MKCSLVILCSFILLIVSCKKEVEPQVPSSPIVGYELLADLSGHWVGTNETSYGFFNWFAFDFRPISASHVHSIYEGGTNQNIITSIFIADFDGKQQIMARNGGWLGPQYRATYFILDIAEIRSNEKYYRLVDAIGGSSRAYIEFRFQDGVMKFDAYKDNSGSLDQPIKHMGFEGSNLNPSFAQAATDLFNFPQEVSEVNLENAFDDLIDPDSALFLTEAEDPFPKSEHGHLSELNLNFNRDPAIANEALLLYISKEPLVGLNGEIDLIAINEKVVRTIDVQGNEDSYLSTYLHPDDYFITAFHDVNGDFIISTGDISSSSTAVEVLPETTIDAEIIVNLFIE